MDKARAFTSMWVIKFLQNKTNPILQDNIQAACSFQREKGPLWESRLDHSQDIEAAGFGLLAMLQHGPQ
jgi:hypothetical protein